MKKVFIFSLISLVVLAGINLPLQAESLKTKNNYIDARNYLSPEKYKYQESRHSNNSNKDTDKETNNGSGNSYRASDEYCMNEDCSITEKIKSETGKKKDKEKKEEKKPD